MKKSVILSIVIIYIVAIIAVGFLGVAMKVYNEKKYVEEIVCTTEGYVATPDASDCDGEIKAKKNDIIVIKCSVKPDNADNTDFDFIYDQTDVDAGKYTVTINNDNTITIKILKTCKPVITVKSTDRNPGVTLRIKINCESAGADIFG